ncbi:hypothetical protein ACP70R_000511 [Stipagrostis hirtigluma subsp. patula]
MAQWCSAMSLDRWAVPRWWGCGSPAPPCRASLAAVVRQRRAWRNGRIGCASVPRELGTAAEAEQTARPVVDADDEEEGVACDGCGVAGWLLCDFCKGKNNVKSEGSRVYRRCPTCKAAGFILCPRCRVYKCITYPDSAES